MTITYTTAWTQKNVKTLEKWQGWVKSLKQGDRILFQQFIKRGNFCLDSQVECWRFFEGKFINEALIRYDNDTHPIKDGYAVYWDSDSRWGDVFDARIVPWHYDVSAKNGCRFRDCHAPIFDEVWSEPGCYRHLILIDRPYAKIYNLVKKLFPRCYYREVAQGWLVTIFGDYDDVTEEKVNAIDGAKYLYSESLKD
jgi:hypothetical protein